MAGLVSCAAGALAIVLGIAGAGKATDLASFRNTLRAHGWPDAVVPHLAVAVPAAELFCAVALLTNARRPASVAAVFMLAMFTGVVIRANRRGVQAACGCFGSPNSEPAPTMDLVRNVVLLMIAMLVLALPAHPGSWPAAAVGAAIGAVFLLTVEWYWMFTRHWLTARG